MGIYKRKGKRGIVWYVRFFLNGREIREAAGPTKDHAVALLAHRIKQRAEIRTYGHPVTLRPQSVAAIVDAYITSREALGRRSVHRMREHAARLVRLLGDRAADALQAADLDGYATARRAEGVAAGTCNREFALLRGALRRAHEAGLLRRLPRVPMLREPPARVRYLVADEVERLRRACRPLLWRMVTVARNTGLRQSELLDLTWRNVDLAARLIHVEASKANTRRDVPVNDACADALGVAGDADALVFPNRKGERITGGNLSQQFARACARAKVSDLTWHDLRHDAASRVIMAGGGLVDVRDLLGHVGVQMAARYSHLAPGRLAAVVGRLMEVAPDSQRKAEPEQEERKG